MNPVEAVTLTRYVKAICPQQKFDEFTSDAWGDVLADVDANEARQAVIRLARRQPFISPAEIIAEIVDVRAENASDFQGPGLPAEVPDADPDDPRAYIAALRAQRFRAADGHELKPRPMKQLMAGITRQIPKQANPELDGVRRPGPLGIICPRCKAARGRPCKKPGSSERFPLGEPMREPHPIRVALATGQPLPQGHDADAEAAGKEASRIALEQLAELDESEAS
ncbi:zinc finger domain-containing protein [Streptomyces yangpuensis]|uniref:zinc finger domain-containing protein n=1 Tax=Streptomyces yangpuensis TaxID=1648182 RepID=UPI0035DDBFCB